MFERFTSPAREAVVLAQDEARQLNQGHIGTEHILLGLLRQKDTLAARALGSLGISAELVRAQLVRVGGEGDDVTTGQIPFTPRAKEALELALREALTLGHDYIGTEHVLLGLARLGQGAAARILADLDAPPRKIAETVIAFLGGTEASRRYAAGFATTVLPAESSGGSPSGTTKATAHAVSDARSHATAVALAVGWSLFAVALGIGVFVGWLIWG